MQTYRIEDKPAFTVFGVHCRLRGDDSAQEMLAFRQAVLQQAQPPVYGMYGVCVKGTDYLIADEMTPGMRVPLGCVKLEIPALTWAVFTFSDGLPQRAHLPEGCGWQQTADVYIEAYMSGDTDGCELWLPVKRPA
ncbi:MAG: GyrI-like domain-containing protein [Clostridia bacterium]|nr:GyrI-like domain-containing protein [Clostridia bacterium]